MFEDGLRSLQELQHETAFPSAAAPVGISVRDVIRERIRAALSRGERLELSVGDFARAIEREAQEGLYELRQELNLDRAALSRLFGDGERAAKQISAWGEASRERPRIRSLRG